MKVRRFLKGRWIAHSFIAGALVLLLLFAFLPACAPEVVPPPEEEEEEEEVVPPPVEPDPYEEYVAGLPEGCEPVPRECFEQAMDEGQLNIYDWAEWWPEEVFTNFEKEFGIKITRDHLASTAEMVTKIKLHPEAPYDMIIVGQRGFMPLRELGLLTEVNWDWLPNVRRYYPEDVRETWWNAGFEDCGVAYCIVFTGYAYNARFVDDPRIPSWAAFFEPDKKYKGRVTVLDSMAETIGCALIYLGYSPNSDDEDELMEARDLLLRQKPYVVAYDSWPKKLVFDQEAWLIGCWTGDALVYHREIESVLAVLPKEGAGLSMSVLFAPIGSTHPAAAHLWENYVFRPKVNALVIETIGYIPVHTGVYELLSEEYREWPGTIPPEGYLDKCELMSADIFTGKGLELRTAIWEELKM